MPRVEIRFDSVTRGLQSGAAKARSEIKSVGNQAQHSTTQASKGFREAERNVGRFSRGALAGSGAVRGLARSVAFASASFLGGVGLIAVLRTSIQRASDLHEEINKTDVVFGASARGIRAWSKTSATAFGLARSEALQFVGTFGNLLTPMGIAPRLAAQMSKRLVELAGDMASFNNASPEEVLQALNSGLTGMVRPLRRFGVFLDQNRIALEAVRSGIVKANVDMGKAADAETKIAVARAKLGEAQRKYGAGTTQVASAEVSLHAAERALQTELAGRVPQLTAAQKAQASYNLILRDTANAQGDFKRTSGGLANQQRILRAELINLQEEIGTALMPTILRLTKGITSYLHSIQEGGRRHEAFVRTMSQVRDVLRVVWGVISSVARALNRVARSMGGWGNAFQLVTSLFLANKFLKLASTIRASRLALILLGRQAVATGGAQTWAAFGAGGSITNKVGATTGRVAALRTALLSLGRLGLITIAIELVIHRKLVGDVLGAIVAGDQPGGPVGIPTAGAQSALEWARYLKGKNFSKAAARRRMKQTGLWYGDEQEIDDALDQVYGRGRPGHRTGGEPVVTGPRGKGPGDRAAFVAVQAARDPAARTVGFHLPGERQPYDCSAFVQAVYRKAGVQIGSTTYQQQNDGSPVSLANITPGDIVLWDVPGDKQGPPNHVGIYIGGGICIHDHGSQGGVDRIPVNYYKIVTIRHIGHGSIAGRQQTGGGPTTADGGPLTVGATPTRKKTDPPDPGELRQTRRSVGFIEAHLTNILSPTLRRNLRRRADALREALLHVHTEGDLRKLEARLKRLVHDFEAAVTLGQSTRIVRKSARELADAINRLPDEMTKDLRLKMQKVQRELGNVTTQGQLNRIRAELKKIQDAVAAAIDKLATIVGQKRDAFGTAFGRVADKMLEVFDAKTQDLLDHARAQVAGFGFEIGVGEETPTERRLREREARKTAEEIAQRIADAQEALQKAQAGGDTQAILDAQRALQEALYDEETQGLQDRADAERRAADAALEARQRDIQTERDLLRERFANRIAEIETNLQNEVITAQEARDQLLALMTDPQYGTNFGDAGALLGAAFAVGMSEALDALTQALNDLVDALNALNEATGGGATAIPKAHGVDYYLHRHRGAGHAYARGGTVPGQWLGREDTIVGRMTAGEEVVDRSTAKALRSFLFGGGHGGGASYGPIYVLGTTEREVAAALARLAHPELGRKIGYGGHSRVSGPTFGEVGDPSTSATG